MLQNGAEQVAVRTDEIAAVQMTQTGRAGRAPRDASGHLHLTAGQRQHQHVVAEANTSVIAFVAEQLHGFLHSEMHSGVRAYTSSSKNARVGPGP